MRTHHYCAYSLARELEDIAKQEKLVVCELVLNAERDKRLELSLAVPGPLVVRPEEPI